MAPIVVESMDLILCSDCWAFGCWDSCDCYYFSCYTKDYYCLDVEAEAAAIWFCLFHLAFSSEICLKPENEEGVAEPLLYTGLGIVWPVDIFLEFEYVGS